jgi:hypothetical protein
MKIDISKDKFDLGKNAAKEAAAKIREAIKMNSCANIIYWTNQ